MDGKFSIAEGGLSFPLPKWRRIAQTFDAPRVESIADAVAREMHKLDSKIRPGMSIARRNAAALAALRPTARSTTASRTSASARAAPGAAGSAAT